MSAKTTDPLVGQIFGRLTVTGESFQIGRYKHTPVKCSCGTTKMVDKQNLTKGKTQSCGCLRSELTSERSRKYPPGSKKTYNIWCAMMSRCSNPENPHYHNYGGRGITVCKRWHKFLNFLADMGDAPDKLTLDRLKNNQGYKPSNCVWVSRRENMLNRRNTVKVTYLGQIVNLIELSELTGVPWRNLYSRIYAGWSIEEAVKSVKFKSPNGQAVWNKHKELTR